MSEMRDNLMEFMRNVERFVGGATGLRLRGYQRKVAERILDSVLHGKGQTIVVIFPRQSGKNELQAQIEAYLLVRFMEHAVEMVKVAPTWKPQTLNAIHRLERVLDTNLITRRLWKKEAGYIVRLGKARIYFFSGQATTNVVGATANLLLSCDEAQDILASKWDKDFNPMAASTNATRVFWGTAWTAETLLAREKREALKAEKVDGERRVFEIDAGSVREEVPAYGAFVDREVAKMGRWHPLVRTQYFSEEMDAAGGMFGKESQALMKGSHAVLEEPEAGKIYAFLLDIGGSFSSLNDPIGVSGSSSRTVEGLRNSTEGRAGAERRAATAPGTAPGSEVAGAGAAEAGRQRR